MIGYARVPEHAPGPAGRGHHDRRRRRRSRTRIRERASAPGSTRRSPSRSSARTTPRLLPGLGRDRTPIPRAQPAQRRVERHAHLAAAAPVRRARRQRQPRQRRCDALRARPGLLGGRAGGAARPGPRPTTRTSTFPHFRSSRCSSASPSMWRAGPPTIAASARRAMCSRVFQRIADDLAGVALRAGPVAESGLHPGRSAALSLDGATVGILGELSFETTAAFEIRGRVAVGSCVSTPSRRRHRGRCATRRHRVSRRSSRTSRSRCRPTGAPAMPWTPSARRRAAARERRAVRRVSRRQPAGREEGMDVPAHVPGPRPDPHRGGGAAGAGGDRGGAGRSVRRGDPPVAEPPRSGSRGRPSGSPAT